MKCRVRLLPLGLCLFAGSAAAEEHHRTALWIDARPWTCSDLVAPLAHAIALACDASGASCRIAASEQEAERRIVLRCKEDGGRWGLDAEGMGGERLWSVGLSGDEDERLRRAALWVARVDADSAAPPAPPRPAPAASPAGPARDDAPAAQRARPPGDAGGGLSLGGHGVYETPGDGSPLVGARGVGAVRISGGTRGILALDGAVPTQTNVRPFSLFRAGVGAAWGAPWTDDYAGASVEVGAAAASNYRFGGTRGAPYGSVALTAQYPHAELRPFVTASLSLFAMKSTGFDATSSLGPMAGLDVGLAWSAW